MRSRWVLTQACIAYPIRSNIMHGDQTQDYTGTQESFFTRRWCAPWEQIDLKLTWSCKVQIKLPQRLTLLYVKEKQTSESQAYRNWVPECVQERATEDWPKAVKCRSNHKVKVNVHLWVKHVWVCTPNWWGQCHTRRLRRRLAGRLGTLRDHC